VTLTFAFGEGSWPPPAVCRTIGGMPADATDTAPMREALLREIAAGGPTRRFPAQTVLIHEGDAADTLFILLAGRVKVYVANENGREIVLRTHGPGDYFGELALDGGRRSASVVTLEPSTCAVVSGAALREFIVEHPDFALHLIRDLMARVRLLTGSVKSLALEDVYGRIAGLLRSLAQPQDGGLVVPDRLTQQDIADRVGSSREMVSRILKELVAGGYVETRQGRITLLKALPAAW
jgi:CRP/FNR family transcriptional regulator, cyclic AMP receptor protein